MTSAWGIKYDPFIYLNKSVVLSPWTREIRIASGAVSLISLAISFFFFLIHSSPFLHSLHFLPHYNSSSSSPSNSSSELLPVHAIIILVPILSFPRLSSIFLPLSCRSFFPSILLSFSFLYPHFPPIHSSF